MIGAMEAQAGLVGAAGAHLDVSGVAARITRFIAARQTRATLAGDEATSERLDASLDTIYFAALLLMVVNGSGTIRDRTQTLGALETAEEIIGDLRCWLTGAAP